MNLLQIFEILHLFYFVASRVQELQCSDWSQRPLTEEQMQYAAVDAYCLIHILEVFKSKAVTEGW